MSSISIMVVEALKTLGQNNTNETTITILKNRLSKEDKECLLKETMDSSAWIYETIRRVCE